MAAPPGQFIALQAINGLKETISGLYFTVLVYEKITFKYMMNKIQINNTFGSKYIFTQTTILKPSQNWLKCSKTVHI